jgi:molybdopterin synthase catalytic subunit
MIELTANAISPDAISARLRRDNRGCVVVFIGTVRNTSKDNKKVTALDIRLRDNNAGDKLEAIVSEICRKWNLTTEDINISRRYGTLKVGEVGLVVAVAAPHRREAFEACEYIIDRIKKGDITAEIDIPA